MNDWAGIAWLVVLLIANAFFVGAEFAVISARRSQIEPLAEKGSRSAKTALYAMEHATLMLATSQLGITICSLLILNVSEPAIHHLLAEPLGLTGWSEGAVDTVGGFIMSVLERIPVVGDAIELEDGTIEVQRMDGRRVDRVRFTPTPMPHEDATEAGDRR